MNTIPEHLRRHEIPERVTLVKGRGDLPKISVKTNWSTAEIYLLGGHVAGFQKNGEPPLLFMSRESQFAVGKPIRGGVPIVFPWFGPREGRALHGFARVTEWEWEESSVAPDSSATLRFRLPDSAARADGSPSANVSFAVTVSDKLTMELAVANPSGTENLSFENCLHTYFAIGDIAQVEITGLKGTTCIDRVANTQGVESAEAIRINLETDRLYLDTTQTVKIHDLKHRRKIRVEKSDSASTVVWNPWVDKARNMPDFGDEEFKQMVCVESGNVAQNKITLAPGKSASLKVVLSSQPL
jgi:glucose-6-phosphate 1-epimerase